MKLDSTHLTLFGLVALAVVAYVVLTLAHQPVPGTITTLITGGAGALFGVTIPARATAPAAEDAP